MFKRNRTRTSSFTQGNTVKLIRGGPEYFDLLEKMIASARSSIHFQFYILENDQTGRRIADALKSAAQRGVQIYVLLDGYASKDLPQDFVEDIRSAGIHIRMFEPILRSQSFYFGRRLHHKVVVTDSWHCLVGGLNVSDRYNNTIEATAWLDWALFSEGPVGPVVVKVCEQRYKSRGMRFNHPMPDIKPLMPHASRTDCAVRIRTNDWVGRKWEISRSYLEMLKSSTSEITIMSPYFLPGEIFRRRIKQAIRRGVDIHVVLAGISDITLSKYAERYMYRWLLRNKVKIHEYQKTVLHGKMAVCDGQWITIGSYNFNNLSAYASIELNMDVKDRAFSSEVQSRLNHIIKSDCRLITEEEYERAGIIEHILQWIAYNIHRVVLFLFTFYFKQKE
jgi:cardiolipin synthase